MATVSALVGFIITGNLINCTLQFSVGWLYICVYEEDRYVRLINYMYHLIDCVSCGSGSGSAYPENLLY